MRWSHITTTTMKKKPANSSRCYICIITLYANRYYKSYERALVHFHVCVYFKCLWNLILNQRAIFLLKALRAHHMKFNTRIRAFCMLLSITFLPVLQCLINGNASIEICCCFSERVKSRRTESICVYGKCMLNLQQRRWWRFIDEVKMINAEVIQLFTERAKEMVRGAQWSEKKAFYFTNYISFRELAHRAVLVVSL